MGELQRSATSFRRQGSSGLVWDDKFLAQLDKITQQQQLQQQNKDNNQLQQQHHAKADTNPTAAVRSTSTIDRSRSNGGGRAFRTGKVPPAIEPPSPRLSACGFCGPFGKREKNWRRRNSCNRIK